MTSLLALLFLAGTVHAAPAARPAYPGAMSDKAFGVLLLAEGGGRDLLDSITTMTTTYAAQFPLEYAGGEADVKAIQKAVDRLQGRRIKKLVVVPLYASSHSPLMEQTRYIFGIREEPPAEFFTAARRPAGYSIQRRVQFQGKLSVVLAAAPDDDPLVVDVLTSRALALSKHPDAEALVLVGLVPDATPPDEAVLGRGPKPPTAADGFRQTLSFLAERVRARGGFKSAHPAVLSPEARHQSEREGREEELRSLVRSLSRSRRVLVVPCAVTGGETAQHIVRALRGTFMRYNEKGLLPDPRMVRWVGQAVNQALPLPDMRVYKDAGKPLPGAVKPLGVKLSGSLK
ncbi:MAG: hypothetical protein HY926_14915 [Elusimicrobia bacterium]|nr:hypothetical protein [Elusimicrobiota bacterium]